MPSIKSKLLALILLLVVPVCTFAQVTEHVTAIAPPSTPLPPEAQSREVKRFPFIVYGDTRGRRDGVAVQYEHSLIVDSMLAQINEI